MEDTDGTIKLIIAFNPQTGKYAMEGPWDDATLFYGMLEMGHEMLLRRRLAQASGRVTGQPAEIITPRGQG